MSGHSVRRQGSDDGPPGVEVTSGARPGLRVTIVIPEDEQHPNDIDRIMRRVRETILSYIEAKKR